jgi:hypothetical protein
MLDPTAPPLPEVPLRVFWSIAIPCLTAGASLGAMFAVTLYRYSARLRAFLERQ